jgi:branched-chain amino acid transport system permease protein
MALPALHPPGAVLEVASTSVGGAADSVRIAYERARPPRPPQEHVVECRFGGGRFDRDRQELVGLSLDGLPLSETRLHVLKRWWLSDPAAAGATPGLSRGELAALPRLPRWLAVALQHVAAALPQIAIYLMLAPAYALIYGLTGKINLAFGELAIIGGQGALIGAVGAVMFGGGGAALVLPAALVVAIAVAATHGDLMSKAVFEPLAGTGPRPALVASLGLMLGLSEYIRIAQGDGMRWTPPLLNAPHHLAVAGDFTVTATEGGMLIVALSALVCASLLLLMRRTRFGRAWRASADDAKAAALMGVDPLATLARTFAVASLLAGLAGFVMTAHYGGIGFSGGLAIGLKALVAAIAGGIGSVPGAMLGAVMVGGFEALWSAFFPIGQAEMAIYALLALFLMFRPGGILGWRELGPRQF